MQPITEIAAKAGIDPNIWNSTETIKLKLIIIF